MAEQINSTIDIFDFIPSVGWSEEQKVKMVLKFMNAYSEYVATELSKQLPEDAQARLSALLVTNPTSTEVIQFYQQLLPNLDQQLLAKANEFRKHFFHELYSNKIAKIQQQLSDSQISGHTNRDAMQKILEIWQALDYMVSNDQWDEAKAMLAAAQKYSM